MALLLLLLLLLDFNGTGSEKQLGIYGKSRQFQDELSNYLEEDIWEELFSVLLSSVKLAWQKFSGCQDPLRGMRAKRREREQSSLDKSCRLELVDLEVRGNVWVFECLSVWMLEGEEEEVEEEKERKGFYDKCDKSFMEENFLNWKMSLD